MLSDDVIICIVGNKIDLEKERHVSKEKALEYAASVGATHYDTSAKLNRGVTDLFLSISESNLYFIHS